MSRVSVVRIEGKVWNVADYLGDREISIFFH